MLIQNMLDDPEAVLAWTKGWIDDCKAGRHIGIKVINDAAEEIKGQYCINGVWNTGVKAIYNLLNDAFELAQVAYDDSKKTDTIAITSIPDSTGSAC